MLQGTPERLHLALWGSKGRRQRGEEKEEKDFVADVFVFEEKVGDSLDIEIGNGIVL